MSLLFFIIRRMLIKNLRQPSKANDLDFYHAIADIYCQVYVSVTSRCSIETVGPIELAALIHSYTYRPRALLSKEAHAKIARLYALA